MDDLTIMSMPATRFATIVAISVALPALLQGVKRLLRGMAAKAPPDSWLAHADAWLFRRWGPLLVHVTSWIAASGVVLWPLVSDGELGLLELVAVIAGGGLASQGVYAASRPVNGRSEAVYSLDGRVGIDWEKAAEAIRGTELPRTGKPWPGGNPKLWTWEAPTESDVVVTESREESDE